MSITSKTKLKATLAQAAALAARRGGLNAAQKAGDTRPAHERAALAEQQAIRREIKRRAHAMRAELVARFPKTFMPFGADKQPLAIGTFEAVMAAAPYPGSRIHFDIALADHATPQARWIGGAA